HFWVECDGRGKALVPGYPQGYCENHYIHSFELENGRIGKIKRNREFMNVFQQLRALSIPVPEIKREGIPT
ncbi:PhzA/PhzB family protein, partial [Pseudomonas aeruginosa]|uniref:PhzA/PhzB family protein n=1 Tax=Pseudomonas aeruginosa TaxID=287 RepID=UPI001BFF4A3A